MSREYFIPDFLVFKPGLSRYGLSRNGLSIVERNDGRGSKGRAADHGVLRLLRAFDSDCILNVTALLNRHASRSDVFGKYLQRKHFFSTYLQVTIMDVSNILASHAAKL